MGVVTEAKSMVGERRAALIDDAVRRWGYGVVKEMLEVPTLNQRCYVCWRHHGFHCVCGEKAGWSRGHPYPKLTGRPSWVVNGRVVPQETVTETVTEEETVTVESVTVEDSVTVSGRVCLECGGGMEGRRRQAVYCSPSCKMKARRRGK